MMAMPLIRRGTTAITHASGWFISVRDENVKKPVLVDPSFYSRKSNRKERRRLAKNGRSGRGAV